MKLDKNNFLLDSNKKIIDALNLIQKNQCGICFLIKDQKIIKSVTDGDIRRSLISGYKLDDKLSKIGNKKFKFIDFNQKLNQDIYDDFKDLKVIPILDKKKRCQEILSYESLNSLKLSKKKIFILGLGYVGLTLGLILAENNFEVIGYDNNKDIRKKLKSKKRTFFENGLQEYLDNYINKNFKIIDYPEYNADVHIISVGTPLKNGTKIPNMQHLKNAIDIVCKNIKKNDLIILRSTVPIGTCRDIVIPLVEKRTKLKFGKDIGISFCPERTVEGLALKELKFLPQLIGSFDKNSYDQSSKIFNKYTSVVNLEKIESAEMAKLIDNTFRDAMFGYSNQMALISEKFNLNLNDIIGKINTGYKRNYVPLPSPGVGGPCLSKDPYLLNYSFKKFNLKASMSIEARKISDKIVKEVFQSCNKFLKKNNINNLNSKIFISGIAFKGDPETSDIRGSTAIDLIEIFKKRKFKNIHLHDFCANNAELREFGKISPNFYSGCSNSNIIIIMNNNKKYLDINLIESLKKIKKPCLIYDSWNVLNPEVIRDIDYITYKSIGRVTE